MCGFIVARDWAGGVARGEFYVSFEGFYLYLWGSWGYGGIVEGGLGRMG